MVKKEMMKLIHKRKLVYFGYQTTNLLRMILIKDDLKNNINPYLPDDQTNV